MLPPVPTAKFSSSTGPGHAPSCPCGWIGAEPHPLPTQEPDQGLPHQRTHRIRLTGCIRLTDELGTIHLTREGKRLGSTHLMGKTLDLEMNLSLSPGMWRCCLVLFIMEQSGITTSKPGVNSPVIISLQLVTVAYQDRNTQCHFYEIVAAPGILNLSLYVSASPSE